MGNWIAAVMAVLGTLLVLAGGAVIVARGLATSGPVGADASTAVTSPTPSSRILGALRRLQAADRLIVWGIVLLVLAAVAAGVISFNFGAAATSATPK